MKLFKKKIRVLPRKYKEEKIGNSRAFVHRTKGQRAITVKFGDTEESKEIARAQMEKRIKERK